MNRQTDFEVYGVSIPHGGTRYYVRRHPRVFGIRMPWTVAVKNGSLDAFMTRREVDEAVLRICGKEEK